MAAQKSVAQLMAEKEARPPTSTAIATSALPASGGKASKRPASAGAGVPSTATAAGAGASAGAGGKLQRPNTAGGNAGGKKSSAIDALLPSVEETLSFGAVKARVGFVKQASTVKVGGVTMTVEPTASANLDARIAGKGQTHAITSAAHESAAQAAAAAATTAAASGAAAAGAGKGKGEKKLSLAKLLAAAEKNQARLDDLRQKKEYTEVGTGAVAADELWEPALKRAAGEKLRDDPALIRKTMRRVKQKKAKSAKEWYVVLTSSARPHCGVVLRALGWRGSVLGAWAAADEVLGVGNVTMCRCCL